MATLAELIADVYTLTNRPDLVNETKLAVKAATLKAHHSDFYPKDLFETGIAWSPVDYIQSLEYRTVIPRWRAFKFLRKYDSAAGQPGTFFQLLTPEQILDRYGIQKDNICYVAGEMLEIRSSTQDTNMLLGCYLHPDISDTGYSSWIALDHPYFIVYEAARTLFKSIGFDEQSAQMNQLVAEQFAGLKMNVTAYGE
jgi:hypothetical protein